MKHYAGLDVAIKTTAICIVAENKEIVFETTTVTDPNAIADAITKTGLNVEVVGIETCGISRWLIHELQEKNVPAIGIDSQKMAALISIRANKTDKNDAREIAQALRADYYQIIYQKDDETASLKTLLNSREGLVEQRVSLINQIRGILKSFGRLSLGSSDNPKKFAESVTQAARGLHEKASLGVRALLSTFLHVSELIDDMDKKLKEIAKEDPAVEILSSMDGIGPVIALTYKAEIADPERFKKSRSVGPYLGLIPRQYSSGETEIYGRITKAGPKGLRALLVDAAKNILYRCNNWSRLKAFGLKILKKKGYKKAIVALARKMAVVLHRMWMDGKPFERGEVGQEEINKLTKPSRKEKREAKKALVA